MHLQCVQMVVDAKP